MARMQKRRRHKVALKSVPNTLMAEFEVFQRISKAELNAKFVLFDEADEQVNTLGLRNPTSPDDAFSEDPELAIASHYPQSSLAELVAWGAMNESSHMHSTLSDLDGDNEF